MKLCNACRRHVRPAEGTCPFCGEALRTTGVARVGAVVLLGALGASCAARPADETATGAGTSGTGTSTGDATTALTTTLPDATSSTSGAASTGASSSTGELTTTNDADSDDPGCSFYGGCPTDFSTEIADCNPWVQDCPAGEKCAPFSGDGDNSWESLQCVPVQMNPGQVGDPCTSEGIASGVDSCDLGHMCWDIDPDTNEGTCIKFCTGTPAEPVCDVPMTACTIANDGVLILCLPTCDPLQQDCEADEVCVQNLGQWICAPDVSGDAGQEWQPCENINACDPGFACASPALSSHCDPNAFGCCLAYCDLSAPNCTDPAEACVPWYEMGMAPPGLENVGVCGIPQ